MGIILLICLWSLPFPFYNSSYKLCAVSCNRHNSFFVGFIMGFSYLHKRSEWNIMNSHVSIAQLQLLSIFTFYKSFSINFSCDKQNNSCPTPPLTSTPIEMSTSESVNMLLYRAKGIWQICLNLNTLIWVDYPELPRWAQPNHVNP